jgi:hypothetical protein
LVYDGRNIPEGYQKWSKDILKEGTGAANISTSCIGKMRINIHNLKIYYIVENTDRTPSVN